MGEETKTWRECLELYNDLQNRAPGIRDQLRAVNGVDFCDAVERCESTDWASQVNAVKRTLRMLQNLRSVNLQDCNLTGFQIRTLYDVFQDLKVQELYVGHNRNINKEGWRSIGMLTARSRLTHINAQHCELDPDDVAEFVQAVDGAEITEFDVSGNESIKAEGWHHLAKLISQCKLQRLVAKNCAPSEECLTKFVNGLENSKLNALDLSHGIEPSIDAILKILPHVNERLVLKGYKFSDDVQDRLREKLSKDHLSLTIEVDDSTGKSLYLRASQEMDLESILPTISEPIPASTPEPIPEPIPEPTPAPIPKPRSKTPYVEGEIIESINKRLVITKEKVIGRRGGRMKVGGCGVEFKAGVMQSDSKVSATVDAASCDVPRGYIGASPELELRTEQPNANCPAVLTLPVYSTLEDGQFDIVHKDDRDAKWHSVNANLKTRGKVVQVFSKLKGIFKAVFPRDKKHILKLRQYLYYKQNPCSLYSMTCVANKTVMKACVDDMKKAGFKSAFVKPEEIALRKNDELRYHITCVHKKASLNPSGEIVLTRKTFIEAKYYQTQLAVEIAEKLILPTLSIKYKLSTPTVKNKESVITLAWDESPSFPSSTMGNMTDSVPMINIATASRPEYGVRMQMGGVYHMEGRSHKGKVLIINNEFKGKGVKERKGSQVDVKNLKTLWLGLGLDVSVKINLTAKQMRDACGDFARDSRNVGVTVLIIMSHGGKTDGQEYFTGEDEEPLQSENVLSYFSSANSPHLKGIPKVFMFQACRGEEKEAGMETSDLETDAGTMSDTSNRQDMLIAYPSQSGYVAFRHRETGSWMMNAVTNVFMRHAHDTHVLDMMTMVNHVISKREGPDRKVQTCNQTNALTKKLFLYPGWQP